MATNRKIHITWAEGKLVMRCLKAVFDRYSQCPTYDIDGEIIKENVEMKKKVKHILELYNKIGVSIYGEKTGI
jgi:hypothetical protein